jgi:putative sigma-54 modulation protein
MKITITGRKMQISSAMRDIIEKKIAKFDRFFSEDTAVDVVATIEKDRHILELTIKYNDIIFRTQQTSDDLYYSLNQAINNIERQIRRHKSHLEKRLRAGSFMASLYRI